MILLSFRYLSDDQFWFTFFHEAGHLVLHNKKALFLEDGSDVTSKEEDDANDFAERILIPSDSREELLRISINKASIWPAPGSEDTELGVLMEPEVDHGETEVYTRVQA